MTRSGELHITVPLAGGAPGPKFDDALTRVLHARWIAQSPADAERISSFWVATAAVAERPPRWATTIVLQGPTELTASAIGGDIVDAIAIAGDP